MLSEVFVQETASSVASRLPSEVWRFHQANRLFREGDYPNALGLYIELYKAEPFQPYLDNAALCARRMGMGKEVTGVALLNLLG